MSDEVDYAQEVIEVCEQAMIQTIRSVLQSEGSSHCESCGEPIPDRRRQAVPWATTCATCQTIIEHRKRVGAMR